MSTENLEIDPKEIDWGSLSDEEMIDTAAVLAARDLDSDEWIKDLVESQRLHGENRYLQAAVFFANPRTPVAVLDAIFEYSWYDEGDHPGIGDYETLAPLIRTHPNITPERREQYLLMLDATMEHMISLNYSGRWTYGEDPNWWNYPDDVRTSVCRMGDIVSGRNLDDVFDITDALTAAYDRAFEKLGDHCGPADPCSACSREADQIVRDDLREERMSYYALSDEFDWDSWNIIVWDLLHNPNILPETVDKIAASPRLDDDCRDLLRKEFGRKV